MSLYNELISWWKLKKNIFVFEYFNVDTQIV